MAQLERAFYDKGKDKGLERIFINELNDCINQKV